MEVRQRRPAKPEDLVASVTAFLKELGAQQETDNKQKRIFHLRLELLRLQIAEILDLDENVDEGARDALERLDQELGAADASLGLKVKCKRGPLVVLNTVALTIYIFLVAMPLMWMVVPLRITHPILRHLGVKNSYLPVDMTIKWFAQGFALFAGIQVTNHWHPDIDMEQNYVAMFTHSSNLDPYLTQAGSPICYKWIGKKQLFRIPIFGWLMTVQGHFPVDRANREKAIQSLDRAAKSIHDYRRSIAIAPEGTRSRNGLLLPFKKGPFHTAAKVDLPILPVVIYNAYERWPPGQMAPTPGNVVVKYLKPIAFPKGTTAREMMCPTRRVFLEELLEAADVPPPNKGTPYQAVRGFLLNLAMLAVPYLYYLVFFAPSPAS